MLLESASMACDLNQRTTFGLFLDQQGRGPRLALGEVTTGETGAFHSLVTVPEQAVPGRSFLVVVGGPFPDCARSTAQVCATYEAAIEVSQRRE